MLSNLIRSLVLVVIGI
ncbi:hypothetical protein LINGRAPRIM_LOCUS2588 [Linum grandiflorum]